MATSTFRKFVSALVVVVFGFLVVDVLPAQTPATNKSTNAQSSSEAELKAKIFAGPEWKQVHDEFEKWLESQAIYSPADIERMKSSMVAQIQTMPASELQGFLDDWQARLKVLNGRDFQDAQQWLGEYLSVLTDGFRRQTLRNLGLTDVANMSAAQLEDAIIRIRADQLSRQQNWAAFEQNRQQAVQRTQQGNAARQSRPTGRAAQFSTNQSPYRPPKFNPPPAPRRQFFVDQNGQIIFGLPF